MGGRSGIKSYEGRLEVLLQHASELVEANSFEAIAEITLNVIESTLNPSVVSFHLVKDNTISPIHSSDSRLKDLVRINLDKPGVISRSLITGKSQLIADTLEEPDYISAPDSVDLIFRSELAVPIIVENEPYAAINIESETPNAFSEEDRTLIDLLAKHVSTNLFRILETQRRSKYENHLEVLSKYSSALNQTTSLDQIFDIVIDVVTNVLEYKYGGVAFIEGDRLVSGKRIGKNPEIPFLSVNEYGIVRRAIQTGLTQLVSDTQNDEDYFPYPSTVVNRSELVVPIKQGEQVLGVIDIEAPEPNAFSPSDVRILDLFAENVAGSIINVKRFNQTRYLEERWRTLLESTKDAIAVFRGTTIIYANQSYADLTGYSSPDSIIGQDLRVLIPEEIQVDIFDLTRRRQKGHHVTERYESQVKHLDGHAIPIEVVANLINLDGDPAVLSFIRDMTQRKQIENDLRNEQKRAQQYLDLAGSIIVSLDKNGDIIIINEYGANLLGYSVSDLIGKNWFDNVITEETREDVFNVFKEAIETASIAESYENPIQIKNGELRQILWNNTYIQNDVGEVIGTLSSGVDVTEIRLSQKLREREFSITKALSELYAPLIQAESTIKEITDVLYLKAIELTESENGFIATVDPNTLDLVNHSYPFSEDMCEFDDDSRDVRFPQNPDGTYNGLWGYGLSEHMAFYTNDVTNHPASKGLPVGHFKLIRFLSVPVTLQNELVGQIALANSNRDYNDHDLIAINRLAEMFSLAIQRRRIESLYRTVVENSINGIAILDENMRFDFINQQNASFYGYTPGELIGKEASILISPDQRDSLKTRFSQQINNFSEPLFFEFTGLHRDGSLLVIETASSPIEYLGKKAILTIQVDVTKSREVLRELERERVQLEQAKEMDEMKTRFIATATHELRTPVTAIQGYLELLRVGAFGIVPERMNQVIQILERNTERLSRLTDDLLDMQRIESGRLTINKKPENVGRILNQILEEMQPHFSSKNQSVTLSIPSDLSTVNIDEVRISQVFLNLMSNASKFSPDDSTISVQVTRAPNALHFKIKDQGIGLTKDDLPKLFTPFPNIKKDQHVTGTGLGLSITKGIIELHGGQIWVESVGANKGTTVHFTLPFSS